MKLSQNDKAIISAYEQGYRADEKGTIYNPEGGEIKGTLTNYIRFKVRGVKGKPLAHRFIAYCWYGERIFGQMVRHLDDDPQNNERTNLELGNARDNYYDMTEEAKERKARGTSKNLRQYDHDKIKDLIQEGKTHRQIKEITGASLGIISRVRNGKTSERCG